MNYIVIIPAYNEAQNIEGTIHAIICQTKLPLQLIVVNDGSSDRTPDIVLPFTLRYPWIKLVNNPVKSGHLPGAKIVRAFYKGYETIKEDFDVIVKLDADIILPVNYFKAILKIFEDHPKVGIAGGVNLVEKNGQWVYEDFADRDHVKGAYKAYRKACFEDIGGLKVSLGWDSVDELLARYHGWEIQTDPNLVIKHLRLRGTSTGFVKVMEKMGRAMYRMRYGLFITFTSAIKAGMVNQPYGWTGLAVLRGWFLAWLQKDAFIVSAAEGKFIRNFRIKRMLEKVQAKSPFK